MRGSSEVVTIKKMVEVEVGETEITVTMTQYQSEVLRSLVGKMGPKQVEGIFNTGFSISKDYTVDETMAVVYDFYEVLYDTIN